MFVYGTLCALMIIVEISGVYTVYCIVYTFWKNPSPFLKSNFLWLKIWDGFRVLSSELGKLDDFYWKNIYFLVLSMKRT